MWDIVAMQTAGLTFSFYVFFDIDDCYHHNSCNGIKLEFKQYSIYDIHIYIYMPCIAPTPSAYLMSVVFSIYTYV